jgi:hypothetical protein
MVRPSRTTETPAKRNGVTGGTVGEPGPGAGRLTLRSRKLVMKSQFS